MNQGLQLLVVALEIIRNKNVSGIMVGVYYCMIYFMEKEKMVDPEVIWGEIAFPLIC